MIERDIGVEVERESGVKVERGHEIAAETDREDQVVTEEKEVGAGIEREEATVEREREAEVEIERDIGEGHLVMKGQGREGEVKVKKSPKKNKAPLWAKFIRARLPTLCRLALLFNWKGSESAGRV